MQKCVYYAQDDGKELAKMEKFCDSPLDLIGQSIRKLINYAS